MTRKEQIMADHAAKVLLINQNLKDWSNAKTEAEIQLLANLEAEYLGVMQNEVFNSLDDAHEAIIKHDFQTLSHKAEKDGGITTSVSQTEKMVQIDLKRFCEFKGLPLDWYAELQALNKRLTMKVGESLGLGPVAMRKIDDSYNMDQIARAIELGETPTSDTQCIKHMQKVLDLLSPGEGKVNGFDLKWVMLTYAKKNNKARLTAQCSKHKALCTLLGDVFYRVATNGKYNVEFPTAKKKPAEQPKQEAEVEVSKPEKPKTGKKQEKKSA